MYEIKMSGVVVQAVTGDITKETTDVIVNSSNSSFSLKSGVSKAILDTAGPTVETECQQLAFFTRRKVDNAQQNEVIEIESQDMDPACFHICGVSQAHVDHAKQVIKDLIVKEQDFNLINDKALFSLSELELQNIYDMQTAMDVSISFHKSSQEEAKLTIEGLSKDVLKASNEIHEMLKKVRPEETFKDVPQHWDDMPANTPCLSFPIQPQTQEHIDVLKQFEDTCKKNVLKIERIQNRSLWGGFQIKKKDMEVRNGHQNNERKLFHGACHTTIDKINELGFNRSYAGKNAALYGDGTYFAVKANYSASDTYSKPDPQGQKYVYLCRVLTGDFTTGKQGMKVPPPKSTTTIQLYDSVTDGVSPPSMFIIFHDNQAYPEYLITFK
ncbi:protein mono-ADP-ribosyltransferase PARP14 isoform X4 [Salmo salar]|uniref:Poly [ADP-ribose] polymerase n=1 Tax=Salmo salar TaxID=8030 RepID=A0ABM3EEW9_SALSA|nr:protein mono-ADP-ribosyltransferase PARP14-like isoform X4 [Salmo salar]|eukprot:XP_014032025.1 PREDICTED: poly [ADP-ribose] polymerase 14-like isoform X4 [Salmo salar]